MKKWLLLFLLWQTSFASVTLTDSELEYIRANPVIKVQNEKVWAPFNFNKNGKPTGLSIDIMNLIASRVGLKVEYIYGPSWNEFMQMLEDGRLDAMVNIVKNSEREKFLLFSTPYQQAHHCIVTREDTPYEYKKPDDILDKLIALENGFYTHDYIAKNSPKTELLLTKNALEALHAVSQGKADLTFGISATLIHSIKANSLNNLKAVWVNGGEMFKPIDLHIAVKKNNPILHSILQKGLNDITNEEKLEIRSKWIDLDLEQRIDWGFIIAISGIFLLILLVVTLYLYTVIRLKNKLSSANASIKQTMEELAHIHKQLEDSIEYASLIQHSIIPKNSLFRSFFGDYFILWYPKDTVGGDIYFFDKISEQEALLIVADCTGHGISGAFVSMMVKAIEREVVSELKRTNEIDVAKILKHFNKNLKVLLKQDKKDALSNVGFDGIVLYINKKDKICKFAGANLPLFVVHNGELTMIKGDKESIGYKNSNIDFEFTEHTIKFDTNTILYLTTDGYIDQNGGARGFPFGNSRFIKTINDNYHETMSDQQEIFLDSLYEYQGDEQRNDDITLIGIRFTEEKEKL